MITIIISLLAVLHKKLLSRKINNLKKIKNLKTEKLKNLVFKDTQLLFDLQFSIV